MSLYVASSYFSMSGNEPLIIQGLVTAEDDQSISTLYDPSPAEQTLPHYAAASEQIRRLRGLAILERASKLIYLKPEPEFEQMLREQSQSASPSGPIDEYLFYQNVNLTHGPDFLGKQAGTSADAAGSASSQGKTWMRCARVRTPKAYGEVRLALEKIEMDLPPERRTDWTVWDGRVQGWHFNSSKMDNYTLVRQSQYRWEDADLVALYHWMRLDVPL
jgi:hypothetical protein